MSAAVMQEVEVADSPAEMACRLVSHSSLEITGRQADELDLLAGVLPRGCHVSITHLPTEQPGDRLKAAVRVRQAGWVPVPHISARRTQSPRELEAILDGWAGEAGVDRVFVIAGDLPR